MHEARHRTGTSRWRIRPRALAALAVASAGLVAAVYLPGRNDVAAAAETGTLFADEFDGDRGDRLDPARWSLDGGRGHGRLDGDGHLVVDRLMSTRTAFTAPTGHAEARIKVRREPGPWRAFGVVDGDGRVLRGKVRTLDHRADPTSGDDFHTYAVDWSPTEIVWSVDGRPNLRLIPDEPGRPLALVLNLATDGWRPGRMVVDFVRVTTAPAPGTPSAGPTSAAPTAAPAPTTTPTSAAPTSAAPTSASPTSAAPKPKPWKAYTDYRAGDLVTFGGATYQVKEAHTALPGWEPSALPNLFKKV